MKHYVIIGLLVLLVVGTIAVGALGFVASRFFSYPTEADITHRLVGDGILRDLGEKAPNDRYFVALGELALDAPETREFKLVGMPASELMFYLVFKGGDDWCTGSLAEDKPPETADDVDVRIEINTTNGSQSFEGSLSEFTWGRWSGKCWLWTWQTQIKSEIAYDASIVVSVTQPLVGLPPAELCIMGGGWKEDAISAEGSIKI